MGPRIHSHVRSNLVGYLALVVALSGPAAAAAKITAADIAKNAVRTKHIRAGAVTEPKIGAGAVTAGKLAPGAVPTVLWAKVENNSGTPSLIQASGAIAVAAAGTGQVRVTFNRDVRPCSYQTAAWLNTTDGTYLDAPILAVERSVSAGTSPNSVDVQAYDGSTGSIDNSGQRDFSVTVFC